MKTILTTGDVARLCQVAPRTVCKWCDSGRLSSYRIPGSHARRIPQRSLLAFLREHGMPIPDELTEQPVTEEVPPSCSDTTTSKSKAAAAGKKPTGKASPRR